MSDHGRLFDNFSRQASHSHGGSYFDIGFGRTVLEDAHGKLFDLFGVPKDSAAHGERFDEFGWESMPAIHGQQFDSDFRAPTANTGEHATWFDAFRGGAEVRYMLDGADYEGTVVECNRDYATVRSRQGQTHEVGLSQFLAYRSPSREQASPATPQSDSDSPSARNPTAHGNSGTTGEPCPTDMPSVAETVSAGPGNPDSRSGVQDGIFDTFTHLKSLSDRYEANDVGKSVDATETAAQGSTSAKTVGHRANCPRGGSDPCGADVDGRCNKCGYKVQDHEAVGKISSGDLGITVGEREHKSTDHHSDGESAPKTCPHCGRVLAQLDEKTEQGSPSRQDCDSTGATFDTVSHKCMAGTLDVLKQLVEA